jgi:hypothetical protein
VASVDHVIEHDAHPTWQLGRAAVTADGEVAAINYAT